MNTRKFWALEIGLVLVSCTIGILMQSVLMSAQDKADVGLTFPILLLVLNVILALLIIKWIERYVNFKR